MGGCAVKGPHGGGRGDSEAREAKWAVCFTRTFQAGNTLWKQHYLTGSVTRNRKSFAKLKIHNNRESCRNQLFNPSPRGDCCQRGACLHALRSTNEWLRAPSAAQLHAPQPDLVLACILENWCPLQTFMKKKSHLPAGFLCCRFTAVNLKGVLQPKPQGSARIIQDLCPPRSLTQVWWCYRDSSYFLRTCHQLF